MTNLALSRLVDPYLHENSTLSEKVSDAFFVGKLMAVLGVVKVSEFLNNVWTASYAEEEIKKIVHSPEKIYGLYKTLETEIEDESASLNEILLNAENPVEGTMCLYGIYQDGFAKNHLASFKQGITEYLRDESASETLEFWDNFNSHYKNNARAIRKAAKSKDVPTRMQARQNLQMQNDCAIFIGEAIINCNSSMRLKYYGHLIANVFSDQNPDKRIKAINGIILDYCLER